eukprot:913850-Pleurochrysis_carterae.AAC.1
MALPLPPRLSLRLLARLLVRLDAFELCKKLCLHRLNLGYGAGRCSRHRVCFRCRACTHRPVRRRRIGCADGIRACLRRAHDRLTGELAQLCEQLLFHRLHVR